MQKLLLQHWDGAIPEIVHLSSEAMRGYANRIGAEYLLMRGKPLDERLTPPCQKLAMLSLAMDAYETVAMADADQFPVAGLTEDVFDQSGFGIYHPDAHRRIMRHLPGLSSSTAPFWGGAIYRLPLSARKALREQYDYNEAKRFNQRGNGEDEGIMHRLAMRAHFSHTGALYFGQEWAWPSYADDMKPAKFVHIRHHNGKGKLCDKMDVYRDLKARGIL